MPFIAGLGYLYVAALDPTAQNTHVSNAHQLPLIPRNVFTVQMSHAGTSESSRTCGFTAAPQYRT